MIYILDRFEEVVAVLSNDGDACPYFNDEFHEWLDNGMATGNFSVPSYHEDASLIPEDGYALIENLDGKLVMFKIRTIEESAGEKRIYTENIALELLGRIVRPAVLEGVSAEYALTHVLLNTGWQVGNIEWSGIETFDFSDYPTVLEAVNNIAAKFPADMVFHVELKNGKIVGRRIDMLQHRGAKDGKRFEYGQDLTEVVRTEDNGTLATALIGVGQNDADGNPTTFEGISGTFTNDAGTAVTKPVGQDWIGDPDALQRWGKNGTHIFGVVKFEETDPAVIMQRTWDALQQTKKPRITFEIDVVLLERLNGAGYAHESTRLGDTVTIVDHSFDPAVIVEARVVEIVYSLSDPSKDYVKLANFREIEVAPEDALASLREYIRQNAGQWEVTGEQIPKTPTPPANPEVDDLWLNTGAMPEMLMRWDGSIWIPASPTEAEHIGAETPSGAQDKADAAEQAAKAYAENRAEVEKYLGHKVQLLREKTGYDEQVANVTANPDLTDATALTAAHNAYTTAYVNLRDEIDAAISGGEVTDAEQTSIEAFTVTYRTEAADLEAALADARDVIAGQKAYEAEQAATEYTTNYAEQKIAKVLIPPSNPVTNDLWIDTSENPPLWKRFNGTTWEKIERTDLSELTGQIVEAQIEDYAVTAQKIVDGAIGSSKIGTGAVTVDKILDGAVESAKIAAGAITEVKLGTNAVTSAKLSDLAVTAAKLADSSVTAQKIANLAVGTAAIQDAAITNAKIDTLDASKITTGVLDAARVQIGAGTMFAEGYDPTEIQVGGRNLVLNSAFQTGDLTEWGADPNVVIEQVDGMFAAKIDDSLDSGLWQGNVLPRNGVYTISFLAKGVTEGAQAWVGFLSYGGESITTPALSTTEWQRFTYTSNELDVTGTTAGDYFHVYNETGTFYITDLKVESGNRATDWTPAPADQLNYAETVAAAEAALAETQANAYADGIVSAEEQARIDADAAKLAEAKSYADQVADAEAQLAETQAKAYADGIVTAEEQARIDADAAKLAEAKAYAESEAAAAESGANSYTDGQVAPINDRLTLWQYTDTTFIDGGNIYTGTITANEIAAGAITAVEIAANAVTTEKIVSGAVVADSIASNAVTTAKIAAGAITANEISADAVTSVKIAANAITATHIAAGTITSNMIATVGLDAGVIKTGVLDAARVQIGASTDFAEGYDPTTKATPEYILSRGENLVTNGTGYLQDNTNFPATVFDGTTTPYGNGSFKFTTGGSSNFFTDEIIPIDPKKPYRFKASLKGSDVNGRFYFAVEPFDRDGLPIKPINVRYIPGSTTTLAQEINDGDTVVYLTDASGFVDTSTFHEQSFIFWNYVSADGFEYPVETYSQNFSGYDMWSQGSIDYTNNTITLDSPWSGGTIPAGTDVSQGGSGGGYIYPITSTPYTLEFTEYEGVIDSYLETAPGGLDGFPPYTAGVKVGFLANRDVAGGMTSWYANISFTNIESEVIAKAHADAVAAAEAQLAETQAKAYADGIVTAEEQARIDADAAKLAEAKAHADQVAAAEAALAESAAEAYADGIVTAEEQARIDADIQKLAEAKSYTDTSVAPINTRIDLWEYPGTTEIDGGNIRTNTILANAINVSSLSAITANLGTVTAGSITANTTIDVGTDLKVGENLVLRTSLNAESGISFMQDTTEVGHIAAQPDGRVWITSYGDGVSLIAQHADDLMVIGNPTFTGVDINLAGNVRVDGDVRLSDISSWYFGNPRFNVVDNGVGSADMFIDGSIDAYRLNAPSAGIDTVYAREIRGEHLADRMLQDHLNGNVTLSAQGNVLYLGYSNTSQVRMSSQVVHSDYKFENGYNMLSVRAPYVNDDTYLMIETSDVCYTNGGTSGYVDINFPVTFDDTPIFAVAQLTDGGSFSYNWGMYNVTPSSCRVYINHIEGYPATVSINVKIVVCGRMASAH